MALHGASIGVLAQHQSTGNERYTPLRYIAAAKTVMAGFDLDPCSDAIANRNVYAMAYFSDGALEKDWHGRVWMNPPYGKINGNQSQAGAFVSKLRHEFSQQRVSQAIYLVHANTAQIWFQQCWADLLCFCDHRIDFLRADGTEIKGQPGAHVFGYMGRRGKDFGGVFRQYGHIVRP